MIYYVEDDRNIRDLVIYTLKQTGFEAVGFESAPPFFAAVAEAVPELILLDVMLPGEDGMSVLRRLRSHDATRLVPVIMITAKVAEYERVEGLDSGADDYITKPFGMMELLSRIRAVLRRSAPSPSQLITLGAITLDIKKHQVFSGGQPIALTLKEFELLRALMQNCGAVLDRERLLDSVWGYSFDGGTRTVDVHIQTLRQKLGDDGARIETVRGVGYKFRE